MFIESELYETSIKINGSDQLSDKKLMKYHIKANVPQKQIRIQLFQIVLTRYFSMFCLNFNLAVFFL